MLKTKNWAHDLGIFGPISLLHNHVNNRQIQRQFICAVRCLALACGYLIYSRVHQRSASGPIYTPKPPCPTDCLPRVYTAPHNGRKFMASVVGLPANTGVYGPGVERLPRFRDAWARAWPGLNIKHQPTINNHPHLRGYGLAVGWFLALTESLEHLRAHNETCDYHLMLEDDALPFNDTIWPSRGHGGNSLDARLDDLVAQRGTAMLLGGHTFRGVNTTDAALAASRPQGGITRASMAFGTYAIVLDCSAVPDIAQHLFHHLRIKRGTDKIFENVLWDVHDTLQKRGRGSGVYVSAPLMVDHAHGYSATWNREVVRPFEGNATFW